MTKDNVHSKIRGQLCPEVERNRTSSTRRGNNMGKNVPQERCAGTTMWQMEASIRRSSNLTISATTSGIVRKTRKRIGNNMVDICKCRSKFCPQSRQCYRFMAPADTLYQAYFARSPRKNGECKYFYPLSTDIQNSLSTPEHKDPLMSHTEGKPSAERGPA